MSLFSSRRRRFVRTTRALIRSHRVLGFGHNENNVVHCAPVGTQPIVDKSSTH
jgi:cyanophycinase-like exopeptidase